MILTKSMTWLITSWIRYADQVNDQGNGAGKLCRSIAAVIQRTKKTADQAWSKVSRADIRQIHGQLPIKREKVAQQDIIQACFSCFWAENAKIMHVFRIIKYAGFWIVGSRVWTGRHNYPLNQHDQRFFFILLSVSTEMQFPDSLYSFDMQSNCHVPIDHAWHVWQHAWQHA